jgi:hypothetical protein
LEWLCFLLLLADCYPQRRVGSSPLLSKVVEEVRDVWKEFKFMFVKRRDLREAEDSISENQLNFQQVLCSARLLYLDLTVPLS